MQPVARDRVVLLDRDGTIVVDRGYLNDPMQLMFLPGVALALQRLTELGCRLLVITNQSGVGRGRITLQSLAQIDERLRAMVRECGARLDGIYSCPHVPEDGCQCRKPAPGLARQAAADFGFDLHSAIVVGDKESDVELARGLGAVSIRLGETGTHTAADFIAPDLAASVSFIERVFALRPSAVSPSLQETNA